MNALTPFLRNGLVATLCTASLAQAADLRIDGAATAVNGGFLLAPGDSLTVGPGGSLQVAGDAVEVTAAGIAVVNEGTVRSLAGDGVEITGDGASVINRGTLAAGSIGVDILGTGARVENAGSVTAAGPAISIAGPGASVVNTGTLSGAGVLVRSDGATIDNSGRVDGTLIGLSVIGNGARVSNTGTVTADGDGILVAGSGAVVSNSGTITAGGNGIVVDGANATVTNTGPVTATGLGILVTGSNATVTNTGQVSGGSAAILIFGENATINLQGAAPLVGAVQILGSNASFTFDLGSARNAAFTFTGQAPGQVSAARGVTGISDSAFYVLDPDLFRAGDTVISDLLRGIGNASAGGPGSGPELVTRGAAGRAGAGWVASFGSWGRLPDSATRTGYDGWTAGLLAGRGTGGGLAVFAGAALSGATSSVPSFAQTGRLAFAGLQGTRRLGGVEARYSLTLGYGWTDTTRTVANNTVAGGIETPRGSYGSLVVSPALQLARPPGSGRLQPRLGLRYAAVFSQGYTETAAAAPMTVAARTTHVLEARPALAYSFAPRRTRAGTVRLGLSAGVDLRGFLGDPVAASFAGTALPVAATAGSFEARGWLGAAVTLAGNGGWTLKAEAEVGHSTLSRTDGRLGVRLGLRF